MEVESGNQNPHTLLQMVTRWWSNLLFIFQPWKMWNYQKSKSQGYFFHTMWNPYTQLFGWYQLCDPSMCNLPGHSWEIQASKACLHWLSNNQSCQLSNPNNHHNLKLDELVITFYFFWNKEGIIVTHLHLLREY